MPSHNRRHYAHVFPHYTEVLLTKAAEIGEHLFMHHSSFCLVADRSLSTRTLWLSADSAEYVAQHFPEVVVNSSECFLEEAR